MVIVFLKVLIWAVCEVDPMIITDETYKVLRTYEV